MNNIRLNKYIAEAGICSRRMADSLIDDKKVKVNGVLVTEKGITIDKDKDVVEVNGNTVPIEFLSNVCFLFSNKLVHNGTLLLNASSCIAHAVFNPI